MVSSKIEPFNTYVGVRMCFIVLNVPCVHLNNEIIPTGRSESKVKQIYMFWQTSFRKYNTAASGHMRRN